MYYGTRGLGEDTPPTGQMPPYMGTLTDGPGQPIPWCSDQPFPGCAPSVVSVGQLSTQETIKRAAIAFSLVGAGLLIGIYGINWLFKDWIEG